MGSRGASTASHGAAADDPIDPFLHAPIPTFVLGLDGRVRRVNVAGEELAGHVVGRVFHDMIEPAVTSDADDAPPNASGAARVRFRHDTRGRPVDLHIGPAVGGAVVVQTVPVDPSALDPDEQHTFRSALLELSELSHEQIDEADFFEALIQTAVRVVPGAQGGSILLRVPDGDEFEFVAAIGFDLEALRQRRLHKDEMFRDVEVRVASINVDLGTDGLDEEQAEWLATAGRIFEIVTNVSSPVFVDGDAIAFLSLDNFEDPHAFDDTSIEMTTLLGRLVADLLRRRGLETELRRERESFKHLALHDSLTGLANRRHVEVVLVDEVTRTRQGGGALGVLFVDVDDFKAVNDDFGHDAGDEVLMAVAEALTDATRSGDVVSRWGGDEFVVVAPGMTSPEAASALAGRILASVADGVTLSDGRVAPCRMSIGIAWTPDGADNATAMLRQADQALYRAKAAGKDTVAVFDREWTITPADRITEAPDPTPADTH